MGDKQYGTQGDVDAFFKYSRGLDNFFQPKSVAVIGATDRPKSVGFTLLSNLSRDSGHEKKKFVLYPINPNRKECCGLTCYPSVVDCPSHVDLAIIVTPLPAVLSVLDSCCEAKTGGVIIITAGFKETGEEGLALEKLLLDHAKQSGVRIIGPNCLGIMSPYWGLNASFAAADALKGGIAFMSQSGAMCTAILDWSREYNVGFTAFVSLGSMVDVDWGDLIDYFDQDPHTHTIMLYMETIGRPQELLSAARRCMKPIFVLKAGRSASAARAAISHTGSLAGSHEAFLAAMKRANIFVLHSISELLNLALLVGTQPHPQGPSLMIVTNAGGPGVLATDGAALAGGEMASMSRSTLLQLNEFLPAPWSHGNPVDILGDASALVFKKTLDVIFDDSTCDGILVILSPQSVTDPKGTALYVIESYEAAKKKGFQKVLLCSWMGGESVQEGARLLVSHGIPVFLNPDDAARYFSLLWCHRQKLHAQPPSRILAQKNPGAYEKAQPLIEKVYQSERTLLTEDESKALLNAYGLCVAPTLHCDSSESAKQQASQLNTWPLVAKVHSETLTHKSDVGGVILHLNTPEEVYDAFKTIQNNVIQHAGLHHFQGITLQPMYDTSLGHEFILGAHYDAQMGPLILFGSGGVLVEIYKDTVLDLPPMSLHEAETMILSTNLGKIFKDTSKKRFKNPNLEKLCHCISLFSLLVCENVERIAEIDINPLFVSQDQVVALDCRVVLHSSRDITKSPYTLPISLYPSHANVMESCGSLKILSSCDVEAIQKDYLKVFPEFIPDTLSKPFSLTRFFKALELNDFTRFLGILVYLTHQDKTVPSGLAVLEHLGGVRDAAQLLYFNFSKNPLCDHELHFLLPQFISLAKSRNILYMTLKHISSPTSSDHSSQTFLHHLLQMPSIQQLDTHTALWRAPLPSSSTFQSTLRA